VRSSVKKGCHCLRQGSHDESADLIYRSCAIYRVRPSQPIPPLQKTDHVVLGSLRESPFSVKTITIEHKQSYFMDLHVSDAYYRPSLRKETTWVVYKGYKPEIKFYIHHYLMESKFQLDNCRWLSLLNVG